MNNKSFEREVAGHSEVVRKHRDTVQKNDVQLVVTDMSTVQFEIGHG